MKAEYCDWYDIQELAERVSSKLKGEFDLIVAVSRGGLVPARVVSDVLGIANIVVVYANHYDHESYGRYKDIQISKIAVSKDVRRILVIDDIYDTGKTLQAIAMQLKQQNVTATFATLLSKKPLEKINGFNFVYGRIVKNAWIIFPWESQEFERVAGK